MPNPLVGSTTITLMCGCLRGGKNLPWRSLSLPLWWRGWLLGDSSRVPGLGCSPEVLTMGPVQQQGRPGRREEGAAVDPARSRQCLGLGGGVPTLVASDLPFYSL